MLKRKIKAMGTNARCALDGYTLRRTTPHRQAETYTAVRASDSPPCLREAGVGTSDDSHSGVAGRRDCAVSSLTRRQEDRCVKRGTP